jgi:hypothetical protein
MPELKDILKSINLTKDKDLIDQYNESDYPAWVVNRALSFYPDTILQVNELNQRPYLPKTMQYKYLVECIRKKNRYSPWLKVKLDPGVQLIKEYFGYSTRKAREVLPMFTNEDLEELKLILDKGGCKK